MHLAANLKKAEYIVEFEGTTLRLIRGTAEETDKILIYSDDTSQTGSDECYEIISRFLDYLSWEWGVGIQLYGATGQGFDKKNIISKLFLLVDFGKEMQEVVYRIFTIFLLLKMIYKDLH